MGKWPLKDFFKIVVWSFVKLEKKKNHLFKNINKFSLYHSIVILLNKNFFDDFLKFVYK